MGKQRDDGLFFLALEFRAVACHLMTSEHFWQTISSPSLFNRLIAAQLPCIPRAQE
jgi:hypothetical protein